MRLNFHKRIGLKPSIGLIFENYGRHFVIGIRAYWSALTLTI